MQEVTCPQCENIVHITPDSPLCSICSTDLDDLLSPEFAAGYFYKRATDMATAGRKQQALTEVNRGLTYCDTSDLRLLGAILANQLGDFGQMRNQVAAIPVDDALREEGEWLLRSHQAKRRAQRTSTKSGQSSPTQESVLPFPINGEAPTPTAASQGRNPWPLGLAIVIITVLALIWFFGLPGHASGSAGRYSYPTGRCRDARNFGGCQRSGERKSGDWWSNGVARSARRCGVAEQLRRRSRKSPTGRQIRLPPMNQQRMALANRQPSCPRRRPLLARLPNRLRKRVQQTDRSM